MRPALFFEGEYEGGTLNLWSGLGPISWNSKTWTGSGNLGSVSEIKETAQLKPEGFVARLSGMPSSLISIALQNVRQGKAGTVWIGFFDESGALIADPYQLARGRVDFASIEDTGETCTIEVNYEGRLIDLEKPRLRRYTHEDQAIDYSDIGSPSSQDRGFEFVPSLQDARFVWGR